MSDKDQAAEQEYIPWSCRFGFHRWQMWRTCGKNSLGEPVQEKNCTICGIKKIRLAEA